MLSEANTNAKKTEVLRAHITIVVVVVSAVLKPKRAAIKTFSSVYY
jgi:hypothetical protein